MTTKRGNQQFCHEKHAAGGAGVVGASGGRATHGPGDAIRRWRRRSTRRHLTGGTQSRRHTYPRPRQEENTKQRIKRMSGQQVSPATSSSSPVQIMAATAATNAHTHSLSLSLFETSWNAAQRAQNFKKKSRRKKTSILPFWGRQQRRRKILER